MDDSTTPPRHPGIRVNLLRAHGSPTNYLYHRGCRCVSCRAALAEYAQVYRASHREGETMRRRNYQAAHHEELAGRRRDRDAARRDELAEYNRLYYAAHREEQTERRRDYCAAHADEVAEYQRDYRATHQDEARAWEQKYRQEHPRRVAEAKRRWAETHPEATAALWRNRRAREQSASGKHTGADVLAQYDRQRGRCYWQSSEMCKARGGKLGGDYHVDHVTPLALGGSNGPENLVISCPTCNTSKGAKHPMDFAGVML